jgi:hypothetical protein
MTVSGRRPWRQVLSTALIRLVPLPFLMALVRLVPANIQQVAVVIFYGSLLLGTGYFLVFASRRPAPTDQREAFRKPMRIMAFGFLLLETLALVVMISVPDGTLSACIQVVMLVLLAGAILFIWRGNRKFSKQAQAHPGKHARPSI